MSEKETSSVVSEPIGQPDLAHRVCGFESVNHPLTESGSLAARDSCGYSGAGHEWSCNLRVNVEKCNRLLVEFILPLTLL